MNFKVSKQFLLNISTAFENRQKGFVEENIEHLHPADIASFLPELDMEEALFVYRHISIEKSSETLVELEEEFRADFLVNFSAKDIADILKLVDSDDATDIVQSLPEYRHNAVLENIKNTHQLKDIEQLLPYDENSAGGIMGREFISVNLNWSAKRSLIELRLQSQETKHVYTIYVIDDEGVLKGTLSLKSFIYADNKTLIKSLYRANPIFVTHNQTTEEVGGVMKKYNLVAIPVVDENGKILGRITIDDVVDILQEEAEKDFQIASGISERIDGKKSVWLISRARIPWLFVGLIGGILGSMVIGNFDPNLLVKYPALAFFIPLIGAMGGNVGVQSSAIMVQSIANQSLNFERGIGFQIIKELLASLLNGFVLSALLFGYCYLARIDDNLTLTLSISLICVTLFAGFFGTLIPLILNKLNIDPALATGPFITTLNDIAGQMIYFSIAYNLFML